MLTKNTIKLIQSLKLKKNRYKNRLFVAEGIKLVTELISTKLTVKNIFITSEELIQRYPELEHQKKLNIISPREMKSISNLQTPSEILLMAEMPEQSEPDSSQKGLFILLDEIQDPGNMGTILRFADWFGVKGIYCSPDCADIYNPKVVQSSMGSFMRLPVIYKPLNELSQVHSTGSVYAADLDGESLFEVNFPEQTFLLLGNEGQGIKPELSKNTKKIHIPGFGKAESLNVAVAGSIITAFWRKQHLKA